MFGEQSATGRAAVNALSDEVKAQSTAFAPQSAASSAVFFAPGDKLNCFKTPKILR